MTAIACKNIRRRNRRRSRTDPLRRCVTGVLDAETQEPGSLTRSRAHWFWPPLPYVYSRAWSPIPCIARCSSANPRISQATVEHLVSSEPRKAASAEAIIAAAQEMRALPIFGNYAEFDSIFWSKFWGPLINDETDLTPAELAAEVRPELEETLPE